MYEPLGGFKVGYCDFTYLDTDSDSEIGPDPTKHLVGGIFYPVSGTTQTSQLRAQSWIPYYGYAYGFAHFVLGMAGYSKMNAWKKIYKIFLRSVMASFAYLLGSATKVPAYQGARICEDKLPVVFISHGVGGNRMVQSCLATELASQGFFVVALEHADGTASAVRMITKEGYKWRYFEMHDEAQRRRQILHRLQEMKTAAKLFTEATNGTILPGFRFQFASDTFSQDLKGKLDMGCATTIGHSFGGGPSCALPLENESPIAAGIGLDAYWPPLPSDHPVYHGAKREAALLLLGSQSWNDPTQKTFIKADKVREKKVAKACSRDCGGAGSIWIVMRGTGHASFTDADLLFGGLTEKLTPWGRPKHAVAPATIIANMNRMILTFLKTHLPLTDSQRNRLKISTIESIAAQSGSQGSTDPELQKPGLEDGIQNTNGRVIEGSVEPWELVERPAGQSGEGAPLEDKAFRPNPGAEVKSTAAIDSARDRHEKSGNTETPVETAIEKQTLQQERHAGNAEASLSTSKMQSAASNTQFGYSRPCEPVQKEEQGIYEAILGEAGLYSLHIDP